MKKALLLLVLLVGATILFASCTKEDPGYSIILAPDGDVITIDGDTGAIVSVNFTEHEIHEGNTFTYIDMIDLAINNVRDIQITTPNTTEWAHLTFTLSSESELDWYLYENVTINVAGAGIVELNSNRNSAHAATTTLAVIDNASVADANADTAVAGAIEIYHGRTGGGKDAGSFSHDQEIILAQNQDYTIRFVATTAGYISYHIHWYEHTDLD